MLNFPFISFAYTKPGEIMWTFSRRLLRYRSHIFQYKKSDAINFASSAIVTRGIKDDSSNSVSKLFQPAAIKEVDASNIGVELTGKINKSQLLSVLNQFSQKKEIFNLCKEYGLDGVYFVRQMMLSDMNNNESHIFHRLHSPAIDCKLSPVLL